MKNAVLITGGAKRLGSLIAQQLSKENYFIIIHYNNSEASNADFIFFLMRATSPPFL